MSSMKYWKQTVLKQYLYYFKIESNLDKILKPHV